jgi:hypothetical protein
MKVRSDYISVSFLTIIFSIMTVIPSQAQSSSERVWKQGSVWVVSYVETKPGHFNDYISDLSNVWKKYMDAQKEDGLVLSYKMLNISFPRDGKPDLMLLVEYKDWAAFDRGVDYFDQLTAKLQGSMEKARQANINREDLRVLRGSKVAQEIMFK